MAHDSKAGLETVSSELASAESFNRTRHQAVISRLNDHVQNDNRNAQKLNGISDQQVKANDINDAGFRAVSARLSQIGVQLQRIQGDNIAFGVMRQSGPLLLNHSEDSNLVTLEAVVLWSHAHYALPIGTLQIRLNQTRHSESSSQLASQERTESVIKVTFTPPRWLSRFAIDYTIRLCCDLATSQWHWGATLKPLTVNHKPSFIKAIEECDVEGVRKCFKDGTAQSSDHILTKWGPEPWFKVNLHDQSQ